MTIWRDFHPSADTLLVAVALAGLGVLATLLVFFEPHPTAKDIMLVIIGSLATFLTRTQPRSEPKQPDDPAPKE